MSRPLLIIILLLLAIGSWWRHDRLADGRRDLLDRATPLLRPVHREALAREVARELDVAQAKSLTARRLFVDTLERLGDPEEARRVRAHLERLDLARHLATEALAEAPGNWRAATIQGASIYLAGSLGRDRRLFTEAPRWETPLLRAAELAPAQAEPRRFLAMAYLEIWRLLPPSKRAEARTLLAEGFEDEATFARLIRPWLATADDLDDALSLLPDRTFVWTGLRQILHNRQDWPAFVRVTEGWYGALRGETASLLEEAAARTASGQGATGRKLQLRALRQLPVDGLFAEEAARLVRAISPGPVDRQSGETIRAWLDWSLERCLIRTCPFDPSVLRRLISLGQPLDPAREALAQEAAGESVRADRLLRAADDDTAPPWRELRILRALHRAGAGDAEEAQRLLDRIPRSQQIGLAYRRALGATQDADAATRRRPDSEGGASFDDLRSALVSAAGREVWEAALWAGADPERRLELVTGRSAGGLRIDFPRVHRSGTALSVRLNGTEVALVALRPGQSYLEVLVELTVGPQVIALERLGGGDSPPGLVSLLP